MGYSNTVTGDANSTDLFRRNAFNLALAAKNLVSSANGLTKGVRVAKTAVEDIQFAVTLLEGMKVPGVEEEFVVTLREPDPIVDVIANVRSQVEAIPLEDFKREPKAKKRAVRPPGSGKMLWMQIGCPQCHVPAGQRCQSLGPDPHEIEKPHTPRKSMAAVVVLP